MYKYCLNYAIMRGTHSQSILGVSAWASMWCTDTSGLLHKTKKITTWAGNYSSHSSLPLFSLSFPPFLLSPSSLLLSFPPTSLLPSFPPTSLLPSLLPLSLLPCLSGQFFGKRHTFTETDSQSRSHGNSNGCHLTHFHPTPLQCQLCHPLQVLPMECSCHTGNNATSPVCRDGVCGGFELKWVGILLSQQQG